MENAFLWIGKTFCIIGGIALALLLLCLLFGLAIEAWRLFSGRFRNVCKAESLIFEYKKMRKEFLQWFEENQKKE